MDMVATIVGLMKMLGAWLSLDCKGSDSLSPQKYPESRVRADLSLRNPYYQHYRKAAIISRKVRSTIGASCWLEVLSTFG